MTDRTHRAHMCAARECPKATPPKHLMCETHWRAVPYEIRREVLGNYREGQESGRVSPTRAWVNAAKAARRAVEDGTPRS